MRSAAEDNDVLKAVAERWSDMIVVWRVTGWRVKVLSRSAEGSFVALQAVVEDYVGEEDGGGLWMNKVMVKFLQ